MNASLLLLLACCLFALASGAVKRPRIIKGRTRPSVVATYGRDRGLRQARNSSVWSDFDGTLTRQFLDVWTANVSRYYLNLGNRSIEALDVDLFSNMTVYGLSLKNNRLANLTPENLNSLAALWFLDVSGNKLSSLVPRLFDKVPNVLAMNLSNNQISTIGADVFKPLSFLSTLDLSGNQLESLADATFSRNLNLKYLYLSQNRLKKIPAISTLSFLRLLNLADNQIDRVEDQTFSRFSHFQHLDLSNNRITYVDIQQFNSLCMGELKIEGNPVAKDIAKKKSQFSCLRVENQTAKALESTAMQVFDGNLNTSVLTAWGYYQNRSQARLLLLNHKEITSVQAGTFDDFPLLNYLHIENNSIADLDSNLFQARPKSLLELFLDKNKLTSVDDQLFSGFEKLQVLSLASNKIQSVDSKAFASLRSLVWLYLNSNKISVIYPFTFKSLQNLKHLDLSNNYISQISSSRLNGLTSLTTLNLADNSIYSIEKNSFDEMSSLTRLDLSENNLYTLTPIDKLNEMCLQELNLHENRISDVSISYDQRARCVVVKRLGSTSTTTYAPEVMLTLFEATSSRNQFWWTTTSTTTTKKRPLVSPGLIMFMVLASVGLIFFLIVILALLHQKRQLPTFIRLA